MATIWRVCLYYAVEFSESKSNTILETELM